jgi:hypothetical protein
MRIRFNPRTAFTLAIAAFFVIAAAIHIKNYFQVGHFFMVVKGDVWDHAFDFISSPGSTASFTLITPFYGIENYPYYTTVYLLPLLFNCAFYGMLAYAGVRCCGLRKDQMKRVGHEILVGTGVAIAGALIVSIVYQLSASVRKDLSFAGDKSAILIPLLIGIPLALGIVSFLRFKKSYGIFRCIASFLFSVSGAE